MVEKRTNYIAFNVGIENSTEILSVLNSYEDYKTSLVSVNFLKEDQKRINKLTKNIENVNLVGKIISAYVATKIAYALVNSCEVMPKELGTTKERLEDCIIACKSCDLGFFKSNFRYFVKRETIENLFKMNLELMLFVDDINKLFQKELNTYITAEMAIPVIMLFNESKPASFVDSVGRFLNNDKNYVDISNLNGLCFKERVNERGRDV